VFAQLSAKYSEAVFIKVNADRCPMSKAAMHISAFPTFIFAQAGNPLPQVCPPLTHCPLMGGLHHTRCLARARVSARSHCSHDLLASLTVNVYLVFKLLMCTVA
jgi:hypothetical protein